MARPENIWYPAVGDTVDVLLPDGRVIRETVRIGATYVGPDVYVWVTRFPYGVPILHVRPPGMWRRSPTREALCRRLYGGKTPYSEVT